MKNQALFSLKDKNKKLKCRLLQFLFGTFRVKIYRNLLVVQKELVVVLLMGNGSHGDSQELQA